MVERVISSAWQFSHFLFYFFPPLDFKMALEFLFVPYIIIKCESFIAKQLPAQLKRGTT